MSVRKRERDAAGAGDESYFKDESGGGRTSRYEAYRDYRPGGVPKRTILVLAGAIGLMFAHSTGALAGAQEVGAAWYASGSAGLQSVLASAYDRARSLRGGGGAIGATSSETARVNFGLPPGATFITREGAQQLETLKRNKQADFGGQMQVIPPSRPLDMKGNPVQAPPPSASEAAARKEEEERRAAEEEERRRAEEEEKRKEEERKAEEAKKAAEEAKKAEEARKAEEEKRKAEEEKRKAEEEKKRAEEEKKKQEEEKKKQEEEKMKQEEQAKAAAAAEPVKAAPAPASGSTANLSATAPISSIPSHSYGGPPSPAVVNEGPRRFLVMQVGHRSFTTY